MTKTLTYSGLAVASLLIIFAFVTAQTYSQLAVAIVLYPALIFLALKIFPRSSLGQPKITVHSPPQNWAGAEAQTLKPNQASAYIADIDRRAFIKLIGAAGISFFLFTLLGRRVETFFFGKTGQLAMNQAGSGGQSGLVQASPTDGYKISEIDEGVVTYYGFINHEGAWLVMREDSDDGNFRYAKGGSNFPAGWASRENLKYDYYYNLF